jgi:hypothetical protein
MKYSLDIQPASPTPLPLRIFVKLDFLYKVAARKQHAYCVAMETEFCISTCKIRLEMEKGKKNGRYKKHRSFVLKSSFTISCVLHEKVALLLRSVHNVTFGSAVPPVMKFG